MRLTLAIAVSWEQSCDDVADGARDVDGGTLLADREA
jgi:hypothetical protein